MEGDHDGGWVSGRGHIIERPRLTRLLDETLARILLLIAPAGYGKTTLAREWLGSRPHTWYRGTQSSSDVAAVAIGLARAAAAFVPGTGERMLKRLGAWADRPTAEIEPLAELLAEDLSSWPADAWLAFDDYHFACDSPPVEAFVELLATLSPIRMLITSRSRPAWATARRLLYGETYEIGRSALAMNEDEARHVLRSVRGSRAREVLALADGWPALIGLAALADESELPEERVPEAMVAYFAEELYRAAPVEVQQGLPRLSLASSISAEIAESLLGARAEEIVEEGLRLGFVTRTSRGRFDLHPLLRSFLETKFSEGRDDAALRLASGLARALIAQGVWDDAFALIDKFFDAELLDELLQAALPALLSAGRLPTIARWVAAATARGADLPLVDLAEAEVAFREGDRARAEALALQAGRRLDGQHPFAVRAFCLAGSAAHLRYRDEIALRHLERAGRIAETAEARRQVSWGRFLAELGLEREEAPQLLQQLEELSDDSADELVRLANGYLLLGQLGGSISSALEAAQQVFPLTSRSRDPFILTSFLNTFASASVLAADYAEAVKAADREISESARFRMAFVLPHARFYKAAALWGMREFKRCTAVAAQAERAAAKFDDRMVTMNVGALRAKLHLASGAPDEALDALDQYERAGATRGMEAEYLAWWSLALACAGDARAARSRARRAASMTVRVEVAALVPWTSAILALSGSRTGRKRAAQRALRLSLASGNVDAFVAAYRARPELLRLLAEDPANVPTLRSVLERARDHSLGQAVGLRVRRTSVEALPAGLSKRELEVLELLAQGLTNKEIGRQLFISEATAKVHVQRILRKLGVHTRTEAALRATELLS